MYSSITVIVYLIFLNHRKWTINRPTGKDGKGRAFIKTLVPEFIQTLTYTQTTFEDKKAVKGQEVFKGLPGTDLICGEKKQGQRGH